MSTENIYTEKLFSYGTLQYEAVQLSTFGRKLNGTSDILIGYRLSTLKITDPNIADISGEAVHPVLIHTGNKEDKVAGMVFEITLEELHSADKYEVADYKRIDVTLSSNIQAWVYIGLNHTTS